MQKSNIKGQSDKSKFKIEFNQRLIHFALTIIKLGNEIRKNRNLQTIADQLIDSATSIGANIIEAKSASSRRDYIKYFEIALKSANETKYWLILTKESSPILKDKINPILLEANEITNIIGSSILTLKGKR